MPWLFPSWSDQGPAFHPLTNEKVSTARKIWQKRPCIKVLALTAVFVLIWYIYGTAHLYRDPGGIFFDKETAYERKYSLQRENEALKFLQENLYEKVARNTQLRPQNVMRVGKKPSVCAVMASYGGQRKESHPLEVLQTLSIGILAY
jgi:hypothetical protein